jgi:hypothetical protein
MTGEITRALMIVNLHPLECLLGLWFESIPCVVQGTENAISNHPLLQCSVLNIELQNASRCVIRENLEKPAHLVGV